MIIRFNSCNSVTLLLFSFFIFHSSFAYAQTGTSLETEIQNTERLIARQGISAQERHTGLVRLATLRQLSGDIEGAARNWLDAARAIPNRVDDNALLNCAYCLAAMGEWDRARTALDPLLSKSARARFLNTSITAVTENNTTALISLAENPEYASMKNEIYFLIWRLSSGNAKERWRQRLVSEFPQSPETAIANSGTLDAGQTIALRQSPFWLFMGGLDSLTLLPSETQGRPAAQTASATPTPTPAATPTPATTPTLAPTPAATPTPAPAPTPPPAPVPSSYARLQTGIYSQQANAQAQAQRLRQSGFTPTIEERTIGTNQMWAVTIPMEQEQALKAAGIEYFPLR